MKRLLLLGIAGTFAHADPRSGGPYSIATETLDSGGQRGTGALYTLDASLCGLGGISEAPAAQQTVKHGFPGQLYDPAALQLTATPATVAEDGTRQITAAVQLDDDTTLPAPAGLTWSVLAGPATISAGGLVTGLPVYQNTAASIQASVIALTGTLPLTVLDTNPDNFGLYAGDGLPDLWQVQHFGQNNPLAAPLQDPDSDGFDNLFEYRACLVPTDPLSYLAMSILETPGGHSVTFSPRFPDCTYTLLGSSDLALWAPVAGTITDNGTVRTIADSAGPETRRFYRIEVQRP